MKRAPFFYALVALAMLAIPLGVAAKPNSAIQGGANQAAGVQATYPQTVFNGFVRIKPKYFGPARPQDTITEHPADPDKVVLVFSGVISNGRMQPYMDDPQILLADADGVTADTRSVQPNGIILQQASAANLFVVFWAPKDFVPDHIVFTCQSTRCKPIRIKFKR
jgi:hypothetical protein